VAVFLKIRKFQIRCLYCTLNFIYFIFFCIAYKASEKKKKGGREGRKTTGTKEAVWAVQFFQSVKVGVLGFTVQVGFRIK